MEKIIMKREKMNDVKGEHREEERKITSTKCI
jgi:hypothetical protein